MLCSQVVRRSTISTLEQIFSLSAGALAINQGSARYRVMRACSLCVVLLSLVLLASAAYEPISMSKKASKSIRPWSARASRPKASDLFDSHAPYAEGSSASPSSLAVGTRQSVSSLGAGTSAHQATVRDSITGLPRVMPPLKQRSRRSMRALLAQIRPVPHRHRHQLLLLILLIRVMARHLAMAC